MDSPPSINCAGQVLAAFCKDWVECKLSDAIRYNVKLLRGGSPLGNVLRNMTTRRHSRPNGGKSMTGADTRQIAIVGMASRLPGAVGPEEFWRLLRGGVDAVGVRGGGRVVGPDRGGFVDGVDEFDAGFFRM